jgi:dolichyl-phosphate-mannose--protein O-mannosyl transferase
MNVFQHGVDYPRRLTATMNELNPAFVKDFISNPTTFTVLLLTLHFKECLKKVFRKFLVRKILITWIIYGAACAAT